MKKKLLTLLAMVAIMIMACLVLAGCGGSDGADDQAADDAAAEAPVLTVANGHFTGAEKDGVLEFKGVPYAKAPVGDLRWKAPEAPDDSDETFDATEFGKTSVQYPWHSEPAGVINPVGEDCLTLNIWTADLETSGKPILFWIHGGGFAWGGTADPLYNGEYIVREHPEAIVISTNYRLGAMGLIDFSDVKGGEDFPDAPYLSILDLIQSLKWVQANAKSFGGDPNNVTIFGESAGGAYVSLLMACKDAEGLFQRAIAESGSVNLTFTKKEFKNVGDRYGSEQTAGKSQAQILMDVSSAKNMDDLMAISEEDMIKYLAETPADEWEDTVTDYYNFPLRGSGSPIPKNPYKAIKNGVNKDVDFIVGTNADEWRYWVDEMSDEAVLGSGDGDAIQAALDAYKEAIAQVKYDEAIAAANNKAEKAAVKKVMKLSGEEDLWWQQTEVGNETGFRIPSIVCAQNHAKAGGNTWMYLFEKKADTEDWLGACHASECAYVFHNLTEVGFSGTMDKDLADQMCSAWVNFAMHGDPSVKGAKWKKYKTPKRATMIFGDDGTLKMKKDPMGKQRKLMTNFAYDYLK